MVVFLPAAFCFFNVNYRHIVKEAWDFAQSEKRLMYYYAFLPSLIATLVGVIYIFYQVISLRRYFAQEEESFIVQIVKLVWSAFSKHPELIPVGIVLLIVVAILYLLYPSFNEGALIQLIARKYNKQGVKLISGLRYGAASFFPILEFNAIFSFLSVTSLLTDGALVLRTLGPEPLKFIAPILLLGAIIGIILSFLFTYAKFFIIIDGEGVFSAINKSTNLVIDHWQSTVLVILILFLIGLRIVLNIILIIVIPGLIVLLAGLFVSLALNYIGYAVAGLIGLLGLYIAGYLGGVLSVFAHAVWTFTFLHLTNEAEATAREASN